MKPPLFILVPSANAALIEEIKRELAPYVRVAETGYRDLATVKLVLEIVGQTIGIAGGVAGILTYLQTTRDRALKAGTPSGIVLKTPGKPAVSLEDADDLLLKSLLEID